MEDITNKTIQEQKHIITIKAINFLTRINNYYQDTYEYINLIDLHYTLKKNIKYNPQIIKNLDLTYINIKAEDNYHKNIRGEEC